MFHGFGHGAGFGVGLGFLNLIGTVLFVLVVIWVIKAAVRGTWRGGRGPGGEADRRPGWWGGPGPLWANQGETAGDEAVRIARERLAAGEITAAEYEAIKRGLGGGDQAGYGRHDPALRIARTRFARGEIGLEEFEAVRRALQA